MLLLFHLHCCCVQCDDVRAFRFLCIDVLFLQHAYRDGSLEEVALRHLGAEDGLTVIAKNIRLSDFLANMHIR